MTIIATMEKQADKCHQKCGHSVPGGYSNSIQDAPWHPVEAQVRKYLASKGKNNFMGRTNSDYYRLRDRYVKCEVGCQRALPGQ